jgi:type VI secretion system protein ImpI
MRLTLTIDNLTTLPDGGPLSYAVEGARGFDIGRDQHLEWTLPDPTRTISGKHCEVRAKGGAYYLYDVSSNGTFLNGSDHRMQSPHRLRSGDRIAIGHYLIDVAVEGDAERLPEIGPAERVRPDPAAGLWTAEGDLAPPIDPRELRPHGTDRPVGVDFMDSSADAFAPTRSGESFAPSAFDSEPSIQPAGGHDAWTGPPVAPSLVHETPTPVPTPRRASPAPDPWTGPHEEAPPAGETAPAAAPAVPSPMPGRGEDAFLRSFAAAAGLPPEVLAGRDPDEVAHRLGSVMKLVVAEMMQLLAARTEAKRMTRSASQTSIAMLDNNPLKFSPSPEDALRILFGPKSRSYLDLQQALSAGFADLKAHEVQTYTALQEAARRLAQELSPEAVEEGLPDEGGLGSLMSSRRARLWDSYVTRWNTTMTRHEHGLVDVFMLYFAECYDRSRR